MHISISIPDLILASDSNTSSEILHNLATPENWWRVRLAVAENPNTSSETLELLATGGSDIIWYRIMLQQHTPLHIKQYLYYKAIDFYYT